MRINPIHIHINDPDFYDEIYAGGGRRRDKCQWSFPVKEPDKMTRSVVATIMHEKHRLRRAPLNQYFSKRSIRNLESLITSGVDRLVKRLRGRYLDGSIINLSDAYTGLTIDIISEYCFGAGAGRLDQHDCGKDFRIMIQKSAQIAPLGKHFPFIYTLTKLPPWILNRLNPQCAPFMRVFEVIEQQVTSDLNRKENDQSQYRTIFHEIRDSDLPDGEKTLPRLMD